MTADEIRTLPADNTNATDQALLREIAAQLAELNANLERVTYDGDKHSSAAIRTVSP